MKEPQDDRRRDYPNLDRHMAEACKTAKCNYRTLAVAAGIPSARITEINSGMRTKPSVVEKIAASLNLTVEQLVEGNVQGAHVALSKLPPRTPSKGVRPRPFEARERYDIDRQLDRACVAAGYVSDRKLADAAGIDAYRIGEIRSGTLVPPSFVEDIAAALNLTVAQLVEGDVENARLVSSHEPPVDREMLARNLTAARSITGISMVELDAAASCGRGYVGALERQTIARPNPERIAALEKALKLPKGSLYGDAAIVAPDPRIEAGTYAPSEPAFPDAISKARG